MIFQVIAPVFIVLLVSFFFAKLKKINLQPLIDISVYLAVPALIFTSIQKNALDPSSFSMLFLGVFFVTIGTGIAAYLFFRFKKIKCRGLYLPIIFMNTGNIGFPVALYALGQEGLTQAIIYSTAGALLIFSLGVYIAAKKMNLIEIFRLPLVYAAFFGIMFSIFNISIPELIFRPLDLLGQIAIPLQLVILGISLAEVKLKCISNAIYASLARFGFGFLLALIFVFSLGVTGLTRDIIILQSTMPAALFNIILSHKYNRNPDMVASTVFISTLLAVITIPFILWFLSM